MQGFKAISRCLCAWTGSMGGFVRLLDRRGSAYLSYSKVNTLESCPYRYYLEYVRRIRLRPQPRYLVKGRLFHQMAARVYRCLARRRTIDAKALHRLIQRQAEGNERQHLRNALRLALEHALADWEVVAVEQPFVLSLGARLPPCIGVIDLILRQGRRYAVVDHKTGKRFNHDGTPPPLMTHPLIGSGYDVDEEEDVDLQLAIYREYVLRAYRPQECLTFYDEYRWVDCLDRIRKPAFQRVGIPLPPDAWQHALDRLKESHQAMRRIERGANTESNGSCWSCPYRLRCRKATTSHGGW